MYTNDYQGKTPPDFTPLLKGDYLSNAKMLVSPTSGHKPPEIIKGKLIGKIDYIFLAPSMRLADIPSPSQTIIAYEKPKINKNEGTNVLFADLHVEWLEMSRFNKLLKDSQKALTKAKQKRIPAEAF